MINEKMRIDFELNKNVAALISLFVKGSIDDNTYILIIGLLIPTNPVVNPYVYSINEIRLFVNFLNRKIFEDRCLF